MSERRDRVIRASEIGQYVYCARAWWLGVVEKREPDNLDLVHTGMAVHEHHGWQVSLSRGLKVLAFALLALSVLALIIWFGLGR